MSYNINRIVANVGQPDNLINGNHITVKTIGVQLKSGRAYKRGDALGRITATGEYTLTDKSKSDGSENFNAVLLDDADAIFGTASAAAAVTGEFNADAMRFGSGEWTDYVFESSKQQLYLSTNNPAPTPILSEEQTDEELAALDFMWIKVGYGANDSAESVTKNIALETSGAYGSTIVWASSDDTVIDPATGAVTSQATDTTIILTATITKGLFTRVKGFELTVKGA